MAPFDTVLIANRGEIALRIMASARKAGFRTVAVYSEADRTAPHVRMADVAVCIGPATAAESYLRTDRILAAARDTGAGAIHPGYGFLSENADFARAVTKAGLVFIGPSAEAIDVMGDKARAKRLMIDAGVPCVPGYQGEDQSEARLLSAAADIGFPVMVKAAGGGGGKGMRLVAEAADLPAALALARSEAQNAFGSDHLILEKAVIEPRHVEIQVFGDTLGNIIHLGERDCSVQRRHQKVIEEAPSPAVDQDLRDRMGAAAIAAARAVNYFGAGTVEFLLDTSGEFYFLEMNTRLQVEHPVTEMVTGIDLVALQLRVAAGLPLGLSQDDVTSVGHAIELRLYAEDPAEGFLPSAGPVALWLPPEGAGIRVDAGIETGGEVSPFYDPMVAKVVAHGATREEARLRLLRAMRGAALFGPANNRDFLIDALGQPEFAEGEATTGFIARTYGESFSGADRSSLGYALAALVHHGVRAEVSRRAAPRVAPELLNWSSAQPIPGVVTYDHDDAPLTCRVLPLGTGYEVHVGDDLHMIETLDLAPPRFAVNVNSQRIEGVFLNTGARGLWIALPNQSFSVTDISGAPRMDEGGGLGYVTAPMHGRLIDLTVAVGDRVEKGQKLAVLEAMKMQHEILAAVSGTVTEIAAATEMQLAAGAMILEISGNTE
ncbi:acetyl-CoA carboxylase biotin carboxylase subunit [Shimia sp. SDUM112013]|uniref:acetyl/propionyl/methylcrotonyl-CoA carboxylase subunit alpha n=1 Tax=Shimia sp. SDUM112013 TaxID=3136160 RepID=UPI0032EBEAC9